MHRLTLLHSQMQCYVSKNSPARIHMQMCTPHCGKGVMNHISLCTGVSGMKPIIISYFGLSLNVLLLGRGGNCHKEADLTILQRGKISLFMMPLES